MSQNLFNPSSSSDPQKLNSNSDSSIFSLFKSHYNNGHPNWKGLIYECRNSRKLVLLVVFIALFFDNMLMTTVVPIIPEYLFELDHPNETAEVLSILKANNPFLLQNQSLNPNNFDVEDMMIMLTTTPITQSTNKHKYLTVEERKWKNVQMNKLNTKIGLMFASKPLVQLIANPFIGPLTNRVGYSLPMFAGFVIMFISTIIFAFGNSYILLFCARAFQGVGSACSSVAGLGMLAERYPDDSERGNAMGIALGGLAMGVLIGPPFGGVVYEFFGKEAPFIILASLGLLDGLLQLLILQPGVQKSQEEGASLKELVHDPYILIAAGAITFANMGIAMMEPSLPIWMINTMNSENWQLGAAFLPASISYLIGTNLFGRISHKIGRWLCCMIGLVVIGVSLILIPFATSIYGLILPNSGLGIGIGMVDSSMMPTMAYLVDIRHSSVYGSVYAIADVAFCLGFALGPALSGFIVNGIGFEWMLIIIAIVCIIYSPFMFFLKNPPGREENLSLIQPAGGGGGTVKYVSYNNQKDNRSSNDSDDDEF